MIDETAEEIREMQTHSSSAVAIRATRALEELLMREYTTVEEFHTAVDQNATVLRRANPSHASLQNALRKVVDDVTESDAADVEEAKSIASAIIQDVATRVESGKRRAAENAADYLAGDATLMTHDYSTTILEALEIATAEGASFDLYVTEARPRYIGRKAARAFSAIDGVDVTLITDAAGGYHLTECDRLVVGMDCIVDDVLYNRVGTFPLAAAATQLDVPVTVLGAASKLITQGFVFENEFRASSEVMLEPASEFAISNPAYDATPVALIENVITDEGEKRF
ncbi:translation initiation factor eIF-2B [Halovivax gelatinilyticus]|uniref:translation initiation factor eIF-2B n=1 Tax=Halovivax gelatinilyticus TaxID=2961597 RepID=UPI0020CA4CBE|nr:translation initiation factor eIF-2B [Halovivax gelatinilyticus]